MSKKNDVVGQRQNDWRERQVPAGQEVTIEKTTSRMKSGKQQSSTWAVRNFSVQDPKITRTDMMKRTIGVLSPGKSPKK